MNQTVNVTSCRSCPLLHYTPGFIDDDCEQVPPKYTCKHPQGGKVGDLWRSIRDGDILPRGCPLRRGILIVRPCPSQCSHSERVYINGELRCLLCGAKVKRRGTRRGEQSGDAMSAIVPQGQSR